MEGTPAEAPPRPTDVGLHWAAGGLVGALAIHALMTPAHLQAWWAAGAFFAVVTLVEAILANFLLVRPSRTVQLTAAGFTVATILVWVVSRTAGLPFGPDAGQPEPVGRPDLTVVGLELMTLAGLAWSLRRTPATGTVPKASRFRSAGVALTATTVVAAVAVAGLPGTVHHGEAHESAAAGHHGEARKLAAPGAISTWATDIVCPTVSDQATPAAPATVRLGTDGGTRFDTTELRVPAGGMTTVSFANRDTVTHNVSVYDPASPGCPPLRGRLVPPGASAEYRLAVAHPGRYRFQCDLHPGQVGTVIAEA